MATAKQNPQPETAGVFCFQGEIYGSPPQVLTSRSDFLRVAKGRRVVTQAFILQGRIRSIDKATVRVGYTCSKKVGNAVARNRAKRRLREASRAVSDIHMNPGWDYVLIGRKDVTSRLAFATLVTELARALQKLHQ